MRITLLALIFSFNLLPCSLLAEVNNPYNNPDKRAEFDLGYNEAKFKPCKDSPILGPAYKRNQSNIESFRVYTNTLNGFERRMLNDAFQAGIKYGEANPIDCKTGELLPKEVEPLATSFYGKWEGNAKAGGTRFPVKLDISENKASSEKYVGSFRYRQSPQRMI